jgi:hypothetical protein
MRVPYKEQCSASLHFYGKRTKNGHNNIVHLANVDLVTRYGGHTPIIIAIEYGRVDTIFILSGSGANWETPNTAGQTAIDLLAAECARESEDYIESPEQSLEWKKMM